MYLVSERARGHSQGTHFVRLGSSRVKEEAMFKIVLDRRTNRYEVVTSIDPERHVLIAEAPRSEHAELIKFHLQSDLDYENFFNQFEDEEDYLAYNA